MLICGLLTCTMLQGLFSPAAFLQANFGEELVSGIENLVVRGWSALIGMMGIMLIYGAFNTTVRNLTLLMAGTSKVLFIALGFAFGRQYMGFGLKTAMIVDSIMILLFALYLMFSRKADVR
ncbi:MAG TPA: hypothetical protein VLL95_14085 [Phnomibacter sp.]|nr:hypothetical protein [Phnomibacter sp.]